MPLYDYSCMDAKGVTRHGSLDVADDRQLRSELSRQGLFLVSWHLRAADPASAAAPAAAPAPEAGDHLITDEEKQSPIAAAYERAMNFFKQPKGMALLVGLIVAGAAGDYVYFTFVAKTNPFFIQEDPNSLGAQLKKIKIGSTRSEVEKILQGRPSHPASPDKTSYELMPQLSVLVGYDSMGGTGSPANKVTSLPTIAVSSGPVGPPAAAPGR